LSYRPLKKVWADPPTAVRVRVKNLRRNQNFDNKDERFFP
jgi:hypothetical protein